MSASLDRLSVEVYLRDLGGTVLVRPIPPALDRQLQRRAVTTGESLDRLRFRYGVVDPSFTAAEVRAIFETHGSAVRLILDRIAEISGTPQAPEHDHLPAPDRQAMRTAATLISAIRRGDHLTIAPRAREQRGSHPGCRRGSRRTAARSGSRGDPDDGDPEPPAPAPGARRQTALGGYRDNSGAA